MQVTVIPADKVISVDGLSLKVDMDMDTTIHSIQWHGAAGAGIISGPGGDAFRDPAVILPYVEAWRVALKALDAATVTEAAAAADAYQKRIAALRARGQTAADDEAAEAAAYQVLLKDRAAVEAAQREAAKQP